MLSCLWQKFIIWRNLGIFFQKPVKRSFIVYFAKARIERMCGNTRDERENNFGILAYMFVSLCHVS